MTKRKKTKQARSRAQRIAAMDPAILDVKGAAELLGVSTTTIYSLARKGQIPATRVGREWRFARQKLIAWVAADSEAPLLAGSGLFMIDLPYPRVGDFAVHDQAGWPTVRLARSG